MELNEALHQRKSRRAFLPTPVDRRDIEKLIAAAQLSPVSCNLQLSQYIVIDDPGVLAELAKRANYKFGMSPCMILIVQDPRFTVERNSGAVAAGAMMQNILLRATELGLSACPMAGFRGDATVREVLKVPDHLELLLLIALGYPDLREPHGPISKVPLGETYRFNGYGDLKTLNGSPNLEDHTMADIIEYRTRIAPVYAYRYRLHTFRNQYYEDAMRTFATLNLAQKARSILDLISYDGIFLKLLVKQFGSEKTVLGAEHVVHNREYFSRDLGVRVVPIDRNNVIDCEASSIDAMTFVFHAEFTPDVEGLIRSAASALKPGGGIFVAIVKDYWYRRIAKSAITAFNRLVRRKLVNIYEGNPFYRVGPRRLISERKLAHVMSAAGLHMTQKGIAARYSTQGTAIAYYVFEKKESVI